MYDIYTKDYNQSKNTIDTSEYPNLILMTFNLWNGYLTNLQINV